jgi:hypothetical protein
MVASCFRLLKSCLLSKSISYLKVTLGDYKELDKLFPDSKIVYLDRALKTE